MKKFFKIKEKEYTPEQNSEMLQTSGVPTAGGYRRPSKFSQFSDYAAQISQQRKQAPLGPGMSGNPYAQGNNSSSNPYAQGGVDKYSGGGGVGSGTGNPYGNAGGNNLNAASSKPYANASKSSEPYSQDSSRAVGYNNSNGTSGGSRSGANSGYTDPYSRGGGGGVEANRYNNSSSSNQNRQTPEGFGRSSQFGSQQSSGASPYAHAQSSYNDRFGVAMSRTETSETTAQARAELFKGANVSGNDSDNKAGDAIAEVDELFELPSEVDKRSGGDVGPRSEYGYEQEQELDSEDEDVEAIKGQIRFTKQESVQSTRNALRLAAEAEESGRNTLGMLGAQGERIANTEQNLALAEIQNQHAEEKARELKTLNRSMFAPHVSNPFNSKKRMLEKEAKIRTQHQQEQIMRENRRQIAYQSQQRVIGGLNSETGMSETALKYKQQYSAAERTKYQFEADSEDEDLESEIDRNLDGIHQAAKRLNKLALATNDEVTAQNERLDRIAEQTDVLDVNVHLNTSRLASIR